MNSRVGLVQRRPVPGDRRMNLVRMTRKGRGILSRVEGAYIAEVRRVMGALSKAEQQTLCGLLARVRGRLGTEG
jgi:DNA-binding MarR family transcriptional regulator